MIKNFIIIIIISIVHKYFNQSDYLKLDLILIYVIFLGFYYDTITAQIYGFFLGAIQDFINFYTLILAMTMTIMGFIYGFLKKTIYLGTYLNSFIFIFVMYWIKQILMLLIIFLFLNDVYLSYIHALMNSSFWMHQLYYAFINALAGYFIFFIFNYHYLKLSKIRI